MQKNAEGETPLLTVYGADEMMALVDAGADVTITSDLPSRNGLSALYRAAGMKPENGSVKLIEKMAAAGADPDQALGIPEGLAMRAAEDTALRAAVSALQPKNVKALLAIGANPNGVPTGSRPLRYLPSEGANEAFDTVVRLMVDAGADPNVIDDDGVSVVIRAAQFYSEKTVDYLLSKGVSLAYGTGLAYEAPNIKLPFRKKLFLPSLIGEADRKDTISLLLPEYTRMIEKFIPRPGGDGTCPHTLLEAFGYAASQERGRSCQDRDLARGKGRSDHRGLAHYCREWRPCQRCGT